MKTLQQYHQQQQEQNQQLGLQIEALAQQLRDLQQQFRVQETIAKNQQTFNQQFEKQVSGLKSLLKDACSLYPVETLDSIKEELNQVIDEVKENYEQLSQSDRFLNAPDEKDDEVISLPLSEPLQIAETLPSENDDEIELTPSQVEIIIEPLSEEVISQIKTMLKIHGKVKDLSKIADHISKIPITHKRLKEFIDGIEASLSFQSKLLA
ncbi:MAG: hypothetical protein QNJ37_04790 [Crocosphaera sp.]|nr:hypothetical protein [Crocosphaera sp.]